MIRQRRSALAFDGKTSISAGSFFTMLARVMPRVDRDLCRRPMPWDVLPWDPTVHLALFAHRIDGLAPGAYMLVRDPAKLVSLKQATYQQFAWTTPSGCPDDLPLFLLEEGDVRQLAAAVSCGQNIAGDGAFIGDDRGIRIQPTAVRTVVLSETFLGDRGNRSGALSRGGGGRCACNRNRLLL